MFHENPEEPPNLLILDDPDADIVLRSCDLQEFRILKRDITRYSPVLDDIIRSTDSTQAMDSSDPSTTEELPCIQISEKGDILSSLLSFILPIPPVLPPTTEQIMELLSVAQKYKMDSTLAHIRAAIAAQDPPFIRPETAFHIFFLARCHGLGPEVGRAARMALAFPMTIQYLEDKFDIMPGVHLYALWKYYERVRINLRSDLQEFRVNGVHSMAGLTCESENGSGVPTWMDEYTTSIEEEPSFFSLYNFHLYLSGHLKKYPGCDCKNVTTRDTFWKAITTVVNNSMAKVSNNEREIVPVKIKALIPSQSEEDILTAGQAELWSHPASGSASLALRQKKKKKKKEKSARGNNFLDVPHADLIVQSSDLVNFRVHKATLSVSSPFFADMFSCPNPLKPML